jgi:hypothetical protein
MNDVRAAQNPHVKPHGPDPQNSQQKSLGFRLTTGAVCVVVVLIGSATGWHCEFPGLQSIQSSTYSEVRLARSLNVDGTDVATYEQGPSILKLRSVSCMATHLRAVRFPLITADGFGFYEKVVGRVFGPACVSPRSSDRSGAGFDEQNVLAFPHYEHS